MTRQVDSPSRLPRISVLGTSALLFEAPGALELEQQQRIWSLAAAAQTWDAVDEAVPGMNNLMLTFTQPPSDLAALRAALLRQWAKGQSVTLEGRLVPRVRDKTADKKVYETTLEITGFQRGEKPKAQSARAPAEA